MIFVDKIRGNLLPSPLLDFQGTRILYGSIHPTRSFLDFFHYALLFITLSEAKMPLVFGYPAGVSKRFYHNSEINYPNHRKKIPSPDELPEREYI